jgi:hypothetical protein
MPLEWTGPRHRLADATSVFLPATQGQRYPYPASRSQEAALGTVRQYHA